MSNYARRLLSIEDFANYSSSRKNTSSVTAHSSPTDRTKSNAINNVHI